MGECIIARSSIGNSEEKEVIATNLPILNNLFPKDVSFKYNESGYNLSVIVDQYPIGCTYQWYKNDQPILGATSPIYNFIPEDVYEVYNIFCIVSNSLGSVTSRVATFTCYPTILYLIDNNGQYNSKLLGNLPADGGYWYTSQHSDKIQLTVYSTSSDGFMSSNTIPLSLYDNISITKQIDSKSNQGRYIGGITNDIYSEGYIAFYSDRSTNKETDIYSLNSVSDDGYLYLANSAIEDSTWATIFFYELKLY